MKTMVPAALTLVLLSCLTFDAQASKKDQEERLQNAADAVHDILALPEGIPGDILNKADCVLVFPAVKKLALGVGGSYGKGAMLCRCGDDFRGPWGPPAMMRLEGGSFGFQIGGSSTDFLLLVMNPKGAKSVLSSKAKLGVDAGVAAGPLGRTAEAATDVTMDAELLSYSRSKGIFAGVSLEGSTLRPDADDNEDLYGHEIDPKELVLGCKDEVPEGAKPLVQALEKATPAHAAPE